MGSFRVLREAEVHRDGFGLRPGAAAVLPATQTLQAQSTPAGGDEIVPQWSAAFTGRAVPPAGSYTATGVNHFSLPDDPCVLAHVAAWTGVAPLPVTCSAVAAAV